MGGTVTARLLKGFRDATPEGEVVRRTYLARLEAVAQKIGAELCGASYASMVEALARITQRLPEAR